VLTPDAKRSEEKQLHRTQNEAKKSNYTGRKTKRRKVITPDAKRSEETQTNRNLLEIPREMEKNNYFFFMRKKLVRFIDSQYEKKSIIPLIHTSCPFLSTPQSTTVVLF